MPQDITKWQLGRQHANNTSTRSCDKQNELLSKGVGGNQEPRTRTKTVARSAAVGMFCRCRMFVNALVGLWMSPPNMPLDACTLMPCNEKPFSVRSAFCSSFANCPLVICHVHHDGYKIVATCFLRWGWLPVLNEWMTHIVSKCNANAVVCGKESGSCGQQ